MRLMHETQLVQVVSTCSRDALVILFIKITSCARCQCFGSNAVEQCGPIVD